VVVTAFTLVSFEYKSPIPKAAQLNSMFQNLEDEEIVDLNINTPPPPPPPPPPPSIVQEIEVTKEEVKVDENIQIIDSDQTDIVIIDVPKVEAPVVDEIFDVVEDDPSFPGGIEELYRYLGKEIQYPAMARDNGIQGKVFVQFVVSKDGSIRDVVVLKKVHPALDKEAVRVVEKMPKWSPGKQRGKPVSCRYTLPINFKIQ
jgi:protein TonB